MTSVRFAVLAAAVALVPVPAAAAERPNVVLMLADDMGYGDLGCYGATKVASPHCDRLAREGRRFTDAHSPSAVCSPTRFGILTGGYPWRENRVPRHLHASEPLVIRNNEPTLASLLKDAGYTTGCIGKWHLGAQRKNPIDWNAPLTPGPNAVGFDYYWGVINSHNQAPYVLVENEKILDLKPGDRIAVEGNQNQTGGPKLRDSTELEAQQTAKAVEFIERNKDRPFFLYYPTAAVHNPITPGKAWQGTSKAGPYGDYVREFDGAVGAVLDALDKHKLTDRTIVVVTSDNGGIARQGSKFGHKPVGDLRGGKATAWEGGHRVPYLVRWPGKVPAGTTCDEVVCHVDLMATICAAVGVKLPTTAGPDSFNVLAAWLGEKLDTPLREATVCVSQQAAVFTIRRGPWKLHLTASKNGKSFTPAGLYNLAADLGETFDRSTAEPKEAKALAALLEKYRADGYSRPGWRVLP